MKLATFLNLHFQNSTVAPTWAWSHIQFKHVWCICTPSNSGKAHVTEQQPPSAFKTQRASFGPGRLTYGYTISSRIIELTCQKESGRLTCAESRGFDLRLDRAHISILMAIYLRKNDYWKSINRNNMPKKGILQGFNVRAFIFIPNSGIEAVTPKWAFWE